MKRLLIFSLVLWTGSVFAQTDPNTPLLSKKTLDSMGVVKVVSYNYALKRNIRGNHISSIQNGDGLDSTTVLPGRTLNKTELGDMMALFNDTSLYGGDVGACFDPRWAFVFYGKGDKILATIDICMECNYLYADFDLPNDVLGEWYEETNEFGEFTGEDINSYFVPKAGFSIAGRKRLDAFCQSLGMTHCRGTISVFDGEEYFKAYEEDE